MISSLNTNLVLQTDFIVELKLKLII